LDSPTFYAKYLLNVIALHLLQSSELIMSRQILFDLGVEAKVLIRRKVSSREEHSAL
jgi:hypothetical protein